MPRASALVAAALGASPAACAAPTCARDAVLLQARATTAQTPATPAGSIGCRDTQGTLPYGGTCVEWALGGHCAESTTLQADCPGSCAEVNKVSHEYTCKQWQEWGHCEESNTLKAECPHLCGQCTQPAPAPATSGAAATPAPTPAPAPVTSDAATTPATEFAPAPAGSTGCSDTQGTLSYGRSRGGTCVEWALGGHCADSTTLQADCPGSCAEVSKVAFREFLVEVNVHEYTCKQWQEWGHCESNTLKAECPHLCGQCR